MLKLGIITCRLGLRAERLFMLFVKIYEKDGKRKAYLYINLGYAKRVLSWDMNLCAELLQISMFELFNKECGDYKIC